MGLGMALDTSKGDVCGRMASKAKGGRSHKFDVGDHWTSGTTEDGVETRDIVVPLQRCQITPSCSRSTGEHTSEDDCRPLRFSCEAAFLA